MVHKRYTHNIKGKIHLKSVTKTISGDMVLFIILSGIYNKNIQM